MPTRWKNVFIVLIIFAILAPIGLNGIFWYQKHQQDQKSKIPPAEIQGPQQSFTDIAVADIVTHNKEAEKAPVLAPYYALSGTIVRGTGQSAYSLVTTDPEQNQVVYLLDAPGVTLGALFRENASVVTKLSKVSQLGDQDTAYLTFYQNSETGVVMGIVKDIVLASGTYSVHLLDDPKNASYAFSSDVSFATSDPSGFFDMKGKTIADLVPGSIVWGSYVPLTVKNDSVRLNSVTIRTPPYRRRAGVVVDVQALGNDTVMINLHNIPGTITANGDTMVYHRGAKLPPLNLAEYRKSSLGVAAIHTGNSVSMFVYLSGNQWKAMAIEVP